MIIITKQWWNFLQPKLKTSWIKNLTTITWSFVCFLKKKQNSLGQIIFLFSHFRPKLPVKKFWLNILFHCKITSANFCINVSVGNFHFLKSFSEIITWILSFQSDYWLTKGSRKCNRYWFFVDLRPRFSQRLPSSVFQTVVLYSWLWFVHLTEEPWQAEQAKLCY